MSRIKELAMNNIEIAYAMIGQAILDETKIGPEAIRISYYTAEEAKCLWEIGKRRGSVNNLRTEKAHGAKRCEGTNLGCSNVRRHLRILEKEGRVRKVGKNVYAVRKNYRPAELWAACAS